jgi:hypothetical protein
MSSSSKKKARRRGKAHKVHVKTLRQQGMTRCFFTGLPVDFVDRNTRKEKAGVQPFDATCEHLVPAILCRDELPGNYVVASSVANNAVGNAPLAVKYEVRERMKQIVIPSWVSYEKRAEMVAFAIKQILRPYLVHEQNQTYVWAWKCIKNNRKLRQEAKERYTALLTPEERALDLAQTGGQQTGTNTDPNQGNDRQTMIQEELDVA